MLAEILKDVITKLALGGDGAMGGTGFLELQKDLKVFSDFALRGAVAEAREVKVNLDKTISFAQSALDLKDTFSDFGAGLSAQASGKRFKITTEVLLITIFTQE